MDLRSIKAEMGMDILRTQSASMVGEEIAVYLLACNLVCALMVRAAAGPGVANPMPSNDGPKIIRC